MALRDDPRMIIKRNHQHPQCCDFRDYTLKFGEIFLVSGSLRRKAFFYLFLTRIKKIYRSTVVLD